MIPDTGGVRIRWALAGKRIPPQRTYASVPAGSLMRRTKNECDHGGTKCNETSDTHLGSWVRAKKKERELTTKTRPKPAANKAARVPKKAPTAGTRIIEGLEQAIVWTRGENDNVRVILVQVPEVDVRKVRTKMGLSQAQFATKFGLPAATLRNWEQGRSRPDAPTRVLLAVIAKHPEAVEDVLRRAS